MDEKRTRMGTEPSNWVVPAYRVPWLLKVAARWFLRFKLREANKEAEYIEAAMCRCKGHVQLQLMRLHEATRMHIRDLEIGLRRL